MVPSRNGIGKIYGYDTIIETNGVIVSPTFGGISRIILDKYREHEF
jgi:hypothetical protein